MVKKLVGKSHLPKLQHEYAQYVPRRELGYLAKTSGSLPNKLIAIFRGWLQ